MTGKIVFTAPSKPLVMQQIEACHNIVGIPQVSRIFEHFICLVELAFPHTFTCIERSAFNLIAGMDN